MASIHETSGRQSEPWTPGEIRLAWIAGIAVSTVLLVAVAIEVFGIGDEDSMAPIQTEPLVIEDGAPPLDTISTNAVRVNMPELI